MTISQFIWTVEAVTKLLFAEGFVRSPGMYTLSVLVYSMHHAKYWLSWRMLGLEPVQPLNAALVHTSWQ